jgi:NAD+ synthase
MDTIKDYGLVFGNLVDGGVRYLRQNKGIKSMIVGLSGGIDSFVTAALAYETANRIERDVKLIGYSLPILTNEQDELDRAKATGDLCDHFTEVDLSIPGINLIQPIDNALYHEFQGNVPAKVSLATKIRVGNIKARLRMMYLYDKAQKYDGMVLSTDNYTEYLLGFWTLHGDVGDFGFIQELWKSEVYHLATWIRDCEIAPAAALACIKAKPTDGLGVSDSDLSQLLPDWDGGYREGYSEIDDLLKTWMACEERDDMEAAEFQKFNYDHPVIQRHIRTEFKRNNPQNISRKFALGVL